MAQMGRPKKNKPKNKQLNVRVDEEMYDNIKNYCDTNNVSIAEFITTLLKLFFGK